MKTTLNGQFLVAYFAYQLMVRLTTATLIQVNTDGVTIKVHNSEFDEYMTICKEWQETTKLVLEYAEYDKMYIADVNNYGARKISENWKVFSEPQYKYKGRFELELDRDFLHKDRSFVVIRRALADYFWNDVQPEDHIARYTEIWDFLGRQKFDRSSYGSIEGEKQQKVTRYYISSKGKAFFKHYIAGKSKGKKARIAGRYFVQVVNQLFSTDIPEDMDYVYYLERIRKEIYGMESGQLSLFGGNEEEDIDESIL